MTLNQILLIIALLLMYSYIITAAIINKGIPDSISHTSYIWEKDCNHKGDAHKYYGFTLYCLITVALVFYPWITSTCETWQFLCFLSCAGMLTAGCSPNFKEGTENKIHYTGAVIAVFSLITWLLINSYFITVAIASIIMLILILIKRTSWTLWVEIVWITTLIITLIIRN